MYTYIYIYYIHIYIYIFYTLFNQSSMMSDGVRYLFAPGRDLGTFQLHRSPRWTGHGTDVSHGGHRMLRLSWGLS